VNIVLIHGTWHGGWVWRDVKRNLQRQGHNVFTPSCTGCGDRIHLTGPDVGLMTHAQDIINLIDAHQLDEVILVGHSFAGVTITVVADILAERLRELIFIDALAPAGEVITCVPRDAETGELPEWWRTREAKFIDGYQMNMWDEYPMDMLLPESAVAERARVKRLLTTHPARQWSDQYELQNGGWSQLKRSYVHCSGQLYQKSSVFMWGEAKKTGWTYQDLPIPRNGMLTHPELVASSIINLMEN